MREVVRRPRCVTMSQDLEWNNELTLRFVRHIAAERVLWDFNDTKYKMKHKVNEAWARISSEMNIPVHVLKNKKKVLMATWRPLFRKKMASIRSEADEDEVFRPVWFAYDAMESFLGSVYDIDGSLNTDYSKQYEEPTAASSPSNQSQHSDDVTILTVKKENEENTDSCTKTPRLTKKRKTFMEINYDEGQSINYSNFDPLNSAAASEGPGASGASKRRSEEEDECDIYAKLLARKLRRYPGRMRDKMMYKIDGLLLDNPYPDELSSPCSSYQ